MEDSADERTCPNPGCGRVFPTKRGCELHYGRYCGAGGGRPLIPAVETNSNFRRGPRPPARGPRPPGSGGPRPPDSRPRPLQPCARAPSQSQRRRSKLPVVGRKENLAKVIRNRPCTKSKPKPYVLCYVSPYVLDYILRNMYMVLWWFLVSR